MFSYFRPRFIQTAPVDLATIFLTFSQRLTGDMYIMKKEE